MRPSLSKIIDLSQLHQLRRKVWRGSLVATNGCFDILHAGHVDYLEKARSLGDRLLVGVNDDASVRALKGEGRPINREFDRLQVLAALECVDHVCLFSGTLACEFLATAMPHIWVKGGDYTPDSLNADEREWVIGGGGKIVIIPVVRAVSTTLLLERTKI